jgi:hypothetical protein
LKEVESNILIHTEPLKIGDNTTQAIMAEDTKDMVKTIETAERKRILNMSVKETTGNVENVDLTITHIEQTVLNVDQRNTTITSGKVRMRNKTLQEKVIKY